jgi:hypothetical protein
MPTQHSSPFLCPYTVGNNNTLWLFFSCANATLFMTNVVKAVTFSPELIIFLYDLSDSPTNK